METRYPAASEHVKFTGGEKESFGLITVLFSKAICCYKFYRHEVSQANVLLLYLKHVLKKMTQMKS